MSTPPVPKWNPVDYPTFWINHASRLLMRGFDEDMRPLGLGMPYFQVAIALSERGPLLQKELAEHARVEQPTMATLLSRMERDGFVRRRPDEHDGRATRLSLTAKAKARTPIVRAAMTHTAERALAGFSRKERAQLTALLRRVVENLS